MSCFVPTKTPKSSLEVEYVEVKMPGCNECEEIMTRAISKFKGVEKCVKDIENQKIAVSGSFKQEKLLRKLSKKTGQEVEIVMNEEKSVGSDSVGECHEKCQMVYVKKVDLETLLRDEDGMYFGKISDPNSDERKNMEKHMMFTDENPNAKCVIS